MRRAPSTRHPGACWLIVLGTLGTACADEAVNNAYLTLRVDYPERNASAMFARIGFARVSDGAFIHDATVALVEGQSLERVIAIEASGAAIEGPLALELTLCADTTCATAAGTKRATVERAFYRGEHTALALTYGALPENELFAVETCAVEGCGGGCDAQGVHLCAVE